MARRKGGEKAGGVLGKAGDGEEAVEAGEEEAGCGCFLLQERDVVGRGI